MRTFIISGACALAFFVPVFAYGAVIINEIAWMGTSVSATDEWIELHNDGLEEVSLAGWALMAADGAPSITLSGTIAAGGYYLLERTDENSVPDITADQIYSGDLGNVGETLTLFDDSGVAVDTVVGGTDWQDIGGYNETKNTPQRQASSTWLTGIPTPKAQNSTVAVAAPASGNGSGSSSSTTKKKAVTGGYKQVVFAHAGQDMTGVARAALRFKGYAVNDKNDRISVATYRWSFGDGARREGKEVMHSYEHPGVYTVVLRVTGDHQEWKDTVMVTILDAEVRVVDAKGGERSYVELRNDADTELDLSGWKLAVRHLRRRLRDKTFTIPEGTVIAPRTSVKFPQSITDLIFSDDDTIILQYPSGIDAVGFDRVASTASSSESS